MPTENSPAPAKVSLEYFPPKGISAERSLMTGAHALRRFQPAYQTITFGADGAATEGSLEWSGNLAGLTEIPTASHITLCRFDRDGFLAHADALWQRGIERLVVLRGDVEEGQGDGLAGFEVLSSAKSPDGSPHFVYAVMLFEPDNYWMMLGAAPPDQRDAALPDFRRIAAGFHRD